MHIACLHVGITATIDNSAEPHYLTMIDILVQTADMGAGKTQKVLMMPQGF